MDAVGCVPEPDDPNSGILRFMLNHFDSIDSHPAAWWTWQLQ